MEATRVRAAQAFLEIGQAIAVGIGRGIVLAGDEAEEALTRVRDPVAVRVAANPDDERQRGRVVREIGVLDGCPGRRGRGGEPEAAGAQAQRHLRARAGREVAELTGHLAGARARGRSRLYRFEREAVWNRQRERRRPGGARARRSRRSLSTRSASPMSSVGGVAESVTWTSADAGGGAFSGMVAVLFAGFASSSLATLAVTHRPTTDASTRVRMRTCPLAPGATTRSARTHDTSWPSSVHVHPSDRALEGRFGWNRERHGDGTARAGGRDVRERGDEVEGGAHCCRVALGRQRELEVGCEARDRDRGAIVEAIRIGLIRAETRRRVDERDRLPRHPRRR